MTPVWYNARKAAQVAAFFAKAQGGKINVLKLTKLIYLADRFALENFESPILNDKFVSMDHGPVNSITYNQINGGQDDDSGVWKEFISARENYYVGLAKPDLKIHDLDELSKAELDVLKMTWERFGKMDRFEVRDYTHKNCPEWEDPNGSSSPIPLERIFKFLGKPNGRELAVKLESERIADELFAQADDLPALEESDSAYAIRAAG